MKPDTGDIGPTRFPRAVRGYSRAAVDEAVAALVDVADGLRSRVAQLEADRNALERRLADDQASAEAHRTELERNLKSAEAERDELIAAFDEIKAERDARTTYITGLEQEIARFRELEQSLTGAVVAADRAGNEARMHAEREVALMLEQARADARQILFDASAERERLLADVQRIRAMLASAQSALHDPMMGVTEGTFGAQG